MADKPYSNRELDAKFSGLSVQLAEVKDVVTSQIQDFETSASAAFSEIKEQTTKTNGRVTTLEDRVVQQNTEAAVFRARIYTAVFILTFIIGSILVPLVAAGISSYTASSASTKTQTP